MSSINIIDGNLQLPIPRAFAPLVAPKRYKAAYGGRGSGKSHFFAEQLVRLCMLGPVRAVCIREVQNTIKDSCYQLLCDKIEKFGVGYLFEILNSEIRNRETKAAIIFKGMQSYNAESIKSLEGVDIVWVEEAQTLSKKSLSILRPTIRKDGSELWFSWNPTDETDAVDQFFRGFRPPSDSVIVEANYRDNPWFPDVLEQEMREDMERDASLAAHIWHGDYLSAPEGAYYANLMAELTAEGRIGEVPHDPNLETHVSFDLGNGPNMCAWFTQWVNQQILAIDFVQGTNDSLREGWPWWVRQLKSKPYVYAPIILPHDARPAQRITGKGDELALREFGFDTLVVPRMNKNEAIKLVQRYLPKCQFDTARCKTGLKALKHFEPNWDEKNRIDRGPLGNWASHPADAFRHAIQAYNAPLEAADKKRRNRPRKAGGWMQ